MQKEFKNEFTLIGYLYNLDLNEKTVQNQTQKNFGKPFINGTLDVATDEDGLNVVSVHFSFVQPVYSSGKENKTYAFLKSLMSEPNDWMTVGKEKAKKIKVTGSVDLNDFYNVKEQKMVSAQRVEGSFVQAASASDALTNSYVLDYIITKVKRVDPDEERGTPEYVEVKGAAFNFRKALLPMSFRVMDPRGMDYVESLGVSGSEPVFTKIFGHLDNITVLKSVEQETAWGDPVVSSRETKIKNWTLDRMAKVPYEFDTEETITADELKKLMQDREVYLAEVKSNAEEYAATNSGSASAPSAPAIGVVSNNDFNF